MITEELFYGIYRGTVVANKDPESHRRLKVTVPQLSGSALTKELPWAWPKEVASMKNEVPEIGDGVWVMYEGGDPSYPLWVGTYGKKTKGKRVNVKVLSDSVSLTGLSGHIITERINNGTTEVDLVATIVALANKVKTLEAQMLTKAPISHSHP
jgi:hypothetical protein